MHQLAAKAAFRAGVPMPTRRPFGEGSGRIRYQFRIKVEY
jgi:hypothetical protein